MKRLLVFSVVFLFIFGMAGVASAVSYSYDFSEMGYSNGQNLEGMTLDVATFTSETSGLRYYTDYGGGIASGVGGTDDIYIVFSEAVSEVSFTAGDGGGDLDAFAITLYEFGTDDLLATYSTPQFGGSDEPEWYTLSASGFSIGRVTFDPGNSGNLPGSSAGTGGVVITDMSYTTASVPEPSTMLLLGLGLAGLAGVSRKKFNR